MVEDVTTTNQDNGVDDNDDRPRRTRSVPHTTGDELSSNRGVSAVSRLFAGRRRSRKENTNDIVEQINNTDQQESRQIHVISMEVCILFFYFSKKKSFLKKNNATFLFQ